MATSLPPTVVWLCPMLEVSMRPVILCPGCDEHKSATRHHIFVRKWYGRKNNNHIILLCWECHCELHTFIPQQKMPHAFYQAILDIFLLKLCKKAKLKQPPLWRLFFSAIINSLSGHQKTASSALSLWSFGFNQGNMLIKKGKRGELAIWECDMCGVHFKCKNGRATEAIKKNGRKFCGDVCFEVFQKETVHKNVTEWAKANPEKLIDKGHGITTDGYVWIYVKGKFHNQIKLHRYLMEIKLGRELRPDEIVHHKDGNKLHNSIDNLEITTISEHNRIHGHFKRDNRTDCWSLEELDDSLVLSYEEFCSKHGNRRTRGALSQKRYKIKKGIQVFPLE